MKHTFIVLFCWLIGCVVVAQKVKFVKEEDGVSYHRMEGKRGNGDTIIVDFRPGCYCYNYNVEQESDKVLKIRGTSDLIPLFLTCENCTQIVSFSQTSRWNSKCISEIVLTAPLSEKQINITMTKKGKLYTTLKVMLYPKVNFFLKIKRADAAAIAIFKHLFIIDSLNDSVFHLSPPKVCDFRNLYTLTT